MFFHWLHNLTAVLRYVQLFFRFKIPTPNLTYSILYWINCLHVYTSQIGLKMTELKKTATETWQVIGRLYLTA